MGMQGKALRSACEDVEDKLPPCHFLEAFDASKNHLDFMIVEEPNAA
jgi:thymidylate synthase